MLLVPSVHRAYAYLLGLYLGDGCITTGMPPGGYVSRLRITLDNRYPGIISQARRAILGVVPSSSVRVIPRRICDSSDVTCYWPYWPTIFPQHGKGTKHQRPIVLAGWQQRITARECHALIRGLIHADGCRFIARQTYRTRPQVHEYARYCFSNRSEDILAIFCDHLGLLGIEWTRPGSHQIQIARRASVERLDSFVGPKR
jgi:hypothetical protein